MKDRLTAQSSATEARCSLRLLAQRIGPGFHPDTPAADYVRDDGSPAFARDEAELIDANLTCIFQILGETEPYDVALNEVQKMLLAC